MEYVGLSHIILTIAQWLDREMPTSSKLKCHPVHAYLEVSHTGHNGT